MGRYPKCKTCANILACENGSHFCRERGEETTPDRSFACETYASSKRKKTKEEISLIRSQAGRKGGKSLFRGGRSPTKQMSVRLEDWEFFGMFASSRKMSMAEVFHRICVGIRMDHPDLEKQSPIS